MSYTACTQTNAAISLSLSYTHTHLSLSVIHTHTHLSLSVIHIHTHTHTNMHTWSEQSLIIFHNLSHSSGLHTSPVRHNTKTLSDKHWSKSMSFTECAAHTHKTSCLQPAAKVSDRTDVCEFKLTLCINGGNLVVWIYKLLGFTPHWLQTRWQPGLAVLCLPRLCEYKV